jgi:hypothetical protein
MVQLHAGVTPLLQDPGYTHTRVADPKRDLSLDEYKQALGVFGVPKKEEEEDPHAPKKHRLLVHTDPDAGIYHNVLQVYRRLCELAYVCRDTDNPLELDMDPTIASDPRYENRKKTSSRHHQ